VGDGRAHALRRRYHEHFQVPEFPVPVESIAEDLLGLAVTRAEMACSGMLFPAARRIVVNASEHAVRQRFTIAHELGHWVCQVLEGTTKPVYCRSDEVDESARKLEREANVFAAELLMPEDAVRASDENMFDVSDIAFRWRLFNLGLGERPE
jgi:hypothetical protein